MTTVSYANDMYMNDDNGVGGGGGGRLTTAAAKQWMKMLAASNHNHRHRFDMDGNHKSLFQSRVNLIDNLSSPTGNGQDFLSMLDSGGGGGGPVSDESHGTGSFIDQPDILNTSKTSSLQEQMSTISSTSLSTLSSSWIIRDCPPSLQLLVKFYRCFGISFTGIIFINDDHFGLQKTTTNHTMMMGKSSTTKIYSSSMYNYNNNYHQNHSKSHHHRQLQQQQQQQSMMNKKFHDNDEERFGLRMQRYFFIGLNITMLIIFLLVLGRLVNDKYLNRMNNRNQTLGMMNSNETIGSELNGTELIEKLPEFNNETLNKSTNIWDDFFQSINLSESHDQIRSLKPILSNIIDFLYIIVVLDELVPIIYLLIRGRRLISLLVRIPFIDQFDHCKRFAYRSLIIAFMTALFINIIGFISFNQTSKQIFMDPDSDFGSRLFTLVAPIFNTFLFVYLSVIPIMFIYTMMLFRFVIEKLLNTYAVVNLDEILMLKLKTKLGDLNDQFKDIIPKFALPLTIHFATNIFIIISSACYLMIDLGPEGTTNTAFIFSLGIFSFLRLIIVACYGNLPTNICRDLIRTVYENLEQWSLNEWMCFMELKRLRKEFTVSIFSMYTVRQSSILAMLGFALNYIVILLQTENYPSAQVDNSTLASNITNDTALMMNDTNVDGNLTKQMLIESDHHSEPIFDTNQLFEWFN
ncbi:hypothetical protein DERF_015919 [Dermatophagoides farinae]|uniref:Uncharacterized protein n=1 Tax=Dermatophagoides farinae TaxID=6954 RepID=A0A922HKR7_DERFA|nr:hypothetical protein DERF_015919 [Dermatophagoides farinae]